MYAERNPPSINEAVDRALSQKGSESGAGYPATSQPSTEVIVKRVLAGVVAFATAGVATFPEHTLAYKACFIVVGLGAALGITSRGVVPK